MTKNQSSPHPSRSTSTLALWIAGVATFCAILVHTYLASHHYDLKFGSELSSNSLCNINATFNCEAVSASRFAEFLGVPMAVWGGMTNAVLLILLLLRPLTDPEKREAGRKNILILATFIALSSVVMGSISAFALGTYCPFCMGAYALSIITAISVWFGLPKETGPQSRVGFEVGNLIPLLVCGVVILIGGFVIDSQAVKGHNGESAAPFARESVAAWLQNVPQKIQTIEPLSRGPDRDKAKMTIVEFADFRCSHCKHAAPIIKAFVSSHPDVRLEFQAWPLDGECNTAISSANGASCLLARAVYCAESLKKHGWDAHEYVYDHQDLYMSLDAVKAGLPSIAEAAGVTPADFEACAQSQATKDMINKQAAVGTGLNLKGTPTIFANGRELPGGQSLLVLSEAYKQIQ